MTDGSSKAASPKQAVLHVGDTDVIVTLDDAKAIETALLEYLKGSSNGDRDELIRMTGPTSVSKDGVMVIGAWLLVVEGDAICARYEAHRGAGYRATLAQKDGAWSVTALNAEFSLFR